jgi:hypothetical protein
MMKKLFFAALIAVTSAVSAAAQDVNPVHYIAARNFEESYAGASNVEWTATQNMSKATFMQNEQKVEVFYNQQGDFVAIARQLKMQDLPSFATKTFAKKYSDYTVTEAFEFKSADEHHYFIAAENDIQNLVLKVDQGSVIVYSKTNKN